MKSLIVTAVLGISSLFTASIYSYQYTDVSGNSVSMSQYQGKKILLVNIGTESPEAAVQIPQLEQLYQQYKDSLVVIGFPSNDFGNEPRTTEEIKLLMQNTYHAVFPMAARTGVKDSTGNMHPVYSWLQHKTENGTMDIRISKDFQKILVDKDGSVIAFFGSRILPMSNTIQNAIRNN
jgi:glutathione peroxidase-family protein